MAQYLETINFNTNLLKQSIDWRLDHILDLAVPYETRQQWVDEVKELMEEIIRDK